MITRDADTHNIIITPDDIPAIAGLIGTAREHLSSDIDSVPGSLRHIFDQFIDAAVRFEKARSVLDD